MLGRGRDPAVSDHSGGVYVTARSVDSQGNVNYATYRLKRRPDVGLINHNDRLHWRDASNQPILMIVNRTAIDVPTTLLLGKRGLAYPDTTKIFVTGRNKGDEGTTAHYIQVP